MKRGGRGSEKALHKFGGIRRTAMYGKTKEMSNKDRVKKQVNEEK